MATASRVRVQIDRMAMARFLYTNQGAQQALGTKAKAVEGTVVANSPYGTSLSWPWRRPMRHGWFRQSIHSTKFRHYWRVYSDDPFGHLVEYGSVKNAIYAPFRRALRQWGGRTAHSFADWNADTTV